MKNIKTEIVLSWAAMGISLVSPLLILPWVSRAFDKSGFGDYLYLLAASSFFTIVCDYGFNITSTRKIARTDQTSEVNRVASQTLALKLIFISLASISLPFLLIDRTGLELLIIALLGAIGTLQPSWYFLGLNKNSINALLTAFGRLITCAMVYMLISNTSTVIEIMILHVAGGLASLIGAWLYLLLNEKFSISFPTISETFHCLKDDFYISISTLAVAGYTSLPIILLGQTSGLPSVAEYASVEKVFKSIEYVLTTALTVIFPIMTGKFNASKYDAISLISKISLAVFGMGIVIVIFSALYGKQLLSFYYGASYSTSSELLLLMSSIPLLGALAVTWGNLGVVNIGRDKSYFLTVASGSVLNTILIIALAPSFGAIGGALALFISSSFIAFVMRRLLIGATRSSR